MTAAPKCCPGLKSLSRVLWLKADPLFMVGKAADSSGSNGYMHRGAHRGRGPSTQGRNREPNIGKDHLPAGAGSNLRRLPGIGEPKPGRGLMVRRMSSSERGRRGNARRGGLRGCPWRGNTSLRQRGSRNWRDRTRAAYEPLSSSWLFQWRPTPSSDWSNRGGEGCMQASALASASSGRAQRQTKTANRNREIRPYGMKTGTPS